MMIGKSMFMKTGLLAALVLSAACAPPVPTPIAATPAAIRQRISGAQGPLTLVHAWATWCQPCREEFPGLLAAYDQHRGNGLRLLLVSADSPDELDAVAEFLREQRSPVGSLVATELNQAFIETLSTNWSGALPASFFFDADGRLVAEHEGKMSAAQYAELIESLLKIQPKGALP